MSGGSKLVDVALVAMPFGPLFTPSLALSLLKPALRRRGLETQTLYFLIDYAERIGQRFYSTVSCSSDLPLGRLAGEWIFSGEVFETGEEQIRDYVEEILRGHGDSGYEARVPKRLIDKVLRARQDAGAFLDECAQRLLQASPRVVGFTSTFQQQVPSLALAKRIKALSPETFVIIGGANCEGVMGAETVRQFPFLDATLSGEGEVVFPELVRRVMAGESIDDLPGVRTREKNDGEFATGHFDNTPAILDLDSVPEAEFDEYLARFKKSRFFRTWQPRLMFETSRGCWWGERSHCTFCGLNGGTMRYRSKSPARAIGELQALLAKHPGHDIEITDNILDLKYFDTVLPELAKLDTGVELFYETKANLKRDQVRTLRDARVLRIQPGIESLSDSVLKLMRKGVTALQNVQLLKWCREFGVRTPWNLLSGFPGEAAEEYERMAEIVPLLAHLQPPEYLGTIRLDRFSPNFTESERLGFTNIQPFAAYRHVYPTLSDGALHNLAYYFTFDYQEARDPRQYTASLWYAVDEWKRVYAESALFSVDTADHLIVWDLRPIAPRFLSVLSGLERRVLLACDAVSQPRQLASLLGTTEDSVRTAADALVAAKLMLRDGDRLLALPIPLGEYSPAPAIVDRFDDIVRAVGEPIRSGIAVPFTLETSPRAGDRQSPAREPRPLTPSRFAIDRNHVVLHESP